MAVTAKFQADFSSFIAAIDKAEVALVDMGKGASSVETKLNRMVDNFSGRKLIQEASLMTIAVEKAGGVATLTATQIQQVGAKAGEAAEKLTKLGYDVPRGLQDLADKTQAANTRFAQMKDIIGTLASAFGVAFSVGAVVNFGRELFTTADNLVKLHDKTGVSIEGLQRFQVAGDDAGNTVDQLTSAIAKLENKLAGEDKSAAAALEKLGLSFEDLKNLTPENQFIAISDAIRKIDDPAQQVNIAMALFGKAGAEILPTLKRGFDDVRGSASAMSADTVKAFDDAGDAIGRWWRTTKGVTAEATVAFVHWVQDGLSPTTHALNEFQREAESTARVVAEITKAAQLKAPKLPTLGPDVIDADAALEQLNATLQANRRFENDAAEAAKKHAAELAKLAEQTRSISFGTFVEDLSKFNAVIPNVSDHVAEMSAKFAEARDQMDDLVSTDISFNSANLETVEGVRKTVTAFSTLPHVVAQATDAIEHAGDSVSISFGEHAITALSNVDKILTHVGGTFATVAAAAARTGEAIVKDLGKGDIFGAIVAGITGVASVIGKLFGNNEEKKINPVRQAFVDAAGGLAELNARAHEAGVTLNALLDARTPEAYQKAIEDLNNAFKFQDDAMQTLNATVEKYGFTISELGPTFAKQKLDEQAGSLLQDYQVLTAAGVDHVAILNKMGPALQDYVTAAEQSGTAIPEALRPVLQSLIDAGQLTDASGEKMTDLSKLTFAETLDKKFSSLIDTINKLTDAISRGLGTAIANIPTEKTIHIGYEYDPFNPPTRDENTNYAAHGGLVTNTGIQYLAGGGRVLAWPTRGSDTVRAMLTPGEGVVTRKGMKTLGTAGLAALNKGGSWDSGASVDITPLVDEISGLRQDIADQDRLLPKRLISAAQTMSRNAA